MNTALTVSTKRSLIVDFNHMAYTYAFGAQPLSVPVTMNGVTTNRDTTIANGATKSIHRWSGHGFHNMAICFDRPCPSRRSFFRAAFDQATGEGYKEQRAGLGRNMFDDMQLVLDMWRESGLSLFGGTGYEADDLVLAAIRRARIDFPDAPIDVVTNDSDLLPLVDEQISVFIRNRKTTWAETKALEKTKYVQVTPANYQEICEERTEYKNSKIKVPYNMLLLVKILRGDSADNIAGLKSDFRPRKVNELIEQIMEDTAMHEAMEGKWDLSIYDIFRYRRNGHREVREVLSWYIQDENVLDRIVRTYVGMNLMQPYTPELFEELGMSTAGLGGSDFRKEVDIQSFSGYDPVRLFEHMKKLRINLPMA